MLVLVLQRLFLDCILDVFYFPLWWYTRGVLYWSKKVAGMIKSGSETLAPGLWLQNIFVPMYGQYDFQGRLVSFVMRSVQVFFRSLAFFVWLAVCALVFVIWFIFPVLVAVSLVSALRIKN